MPATVLYLNTDPLACIPQMTLAGMHRYAASRGWTAQAFSAAESRQFRLAALFRKHAPVVGCVWECTDDGFPETPSPLDDVPVVYLHASRDVPGNGVRYTNGEAKGLDGQGRAHLTSARPAELTLRVSGSDGTHGTINKIGSLRIYDRQLTPEEVAYNRMVDVARFEGGPFAPSVSRPAWAPAPLSVERTSGMGAASASATLAFAGASQSRRLYVAYGTSDAGTATNAYAGRRPARAVLRPARVPGPCPGEGAPAAGRRPPRSGVDGPRPGCPG